MFNRAWLAGGIPRTACVAAYEPVCAVSRADSYINRANPGTYDATAPVAAPTWADSTGWTFNGTTQYLSTGLNQADGMSVVLRLSNLSGAVGTPFGDRGDPRIFLVANHPEFWHYGSYNGGGTTLVGTQVQVTAITPGRGYLNGRLVTEFTYTWGGGYYLPMTIGARNYSGGVYSFMGVDIQALYIYNVTLTPTQVKAVTDAMNMLPMRPQLPRFRSWMMGGALTQFRKAFGLRTGSRGVPE